MLRSAEARSLVILYAILIRFIRTRNGADYIRARCKNRAFSFKNQNSPVYVPCIGAKDNCERNVEIFPKSFAANQNKVVESNGESEMS